MSNLEQAKGTGDSPAIGGLVKSDIVFTYIVRYLCRYTITQKG